MIGRNVTWILFEILVFVGLEQAYCITTPVSKSSALIHPSWFTAVPPSPGSPTSRQNKAMVRELKSQLCTINNPVPYCGRFKFGVNFQDPATPAQSTWASFLKSGIRSVRLVAFDDSVVTVDANVTQLAIELVQKVDWNSTLLNWTEFGNHLSSSVIPTFHLRCRRNRQETTLQTELDHSFPPDVARPLRYAFALALHQSTGWIPEPDRQAAALEINLILHSSNNKPSVLIEVPVLLPPLNSRVRDLPRPGFRRVESWAIAKCAEIQPTDVVLDPMCGRATFIVEAASFWPACNFVGVDCDAEQLEDAKINLKETRVETIINLIQGDCRQLSFEDCSIDKILSCPPFGKQFAKDSNLYDEALKEWSRVLKPQNGKMVLVIDEDNLDALVASINKYACQVVQARQVRLGRLQAFILIVTKKSIDSFEPSPQPLPFVSKFDWERVNRHKYGNALDRALWTLLRAESLPPLVPAHG